jgi:hypothetical protein
LTTLVRPPGGQAGSWAAAPPPWGPRRGPRGRFGFGRRRLKPPPSVSGSSSISGVWWLAHQTSQIP